MTQEEVIVKIPFYANLQGLSKNTEEDYVTNVRACPEKLKACSLSLAAS